MASSSSSPEDTIADTMDFPIIRRARPTDKMGFPRDNPVVNGFAYRIPHTPERELPGGANWVVQKFGGTSVGKFSVAIAEDIVLYVHRNATSKRNTGRGSEV